MQQELDIHSALQRMQQLAGESPLVTASAWHEGSLYVRLAGVKTAVEASTRSIGGETCESSIWSDLNNQKLSFFSNSSPLWRISVPPLTAELDIDGTCLYDWAGMQRWLYSKEDAGKIRETAEQAGGHAQLFKAEATLKQQLGAFHPQTDEIMALHKNIKNEFDPHKLFNPGRLYGGF